MVYIITINIYINDMEDIYKTLLNNKIITPRLFELPDKVKNNPVMYKYYSDNKQFKICYAGRRSYKTELAKRMLIAKALETSKCRIIVGAATYSQTKLIYWDSLKDMIPKIFQKKVMENELRIELINGSRIELFSADSVQRIEGGHPVSMAVLDEASEYNIKTVFNRNILPLLADINGNAIILGVPRTSFSQEFREMVQQYNDPINYPEWSVYSWSSEDILSPTIIESFKSISDSRTYETEFLGKFVDDISGKAYYNFLENDHILNIPFNPQLPIQISLDFNTGIMAPLFSQVLKDGFINVFHQFTDRQTNVFKIAPMIQAELYKFLGERAKSQKLIFYGDYAGFALTAGARGSAWDEIKQFFVGWNGELRVRNNPPIDRRVASVNSRLKTADGKIHMAINPMCNELIKDLKFVTLDDLTINKHKQIDRTHSSDSLGYFVDYEYSIKHSVYN